MSPSTQSIRLVITDLIDVRIYEGSLKCQKQPAKVISVPSTTAVDVIVLDQCVANCRNSESFLENIWDETLGVKAGILT